MEDYYYYIKDINAKKIATVCLLAENGEIVSRGLAICSELDQFSKKLGRTIAHGRALKGYKSGCSGLIKRPEGRVILSRAANVNIFTCWKSARVFGPKNSIEDKIFDVVKKKRDLNMLMLNDAVAG